MHCRLSIQSKHRTPFIEDYEIVTYTLKRSSTEAEF